MAYAATITDTHFISKSGRKYPLFKGTKDEWRDLAKEWGKQGDTQMENFYQKYGRMLAEDGELLVVKSTTPKGSSKRSYKVTSSEGVGAESIRRAKKTRGTNVEIEQQIERLDLHQRLIGELNEGNITIEDFHQQMKALYRSHRKPYNPDQVLNAEGWPQGKSKEGFLKWQSKVYSEAQQEAAAFAQEQGLKTDAGHAMPAAEGGPDARSNVQPEPGALNKIKQEQARGNVQLTDADKAARKGVLEYVGIATDKTLAFQEYLMEGTSPNVRSFNSYNQYFRSALAHDTGLDFRQVDTLLSQAEDDLLNRGTIERRFSKEKQKNLILPDVTEGGEVSVHTDPREKMTPWEQKQTKQLRREGAHEFQGTGDPVDLETGQQIFPEQDPNDITKLAETPTERTRISNVNTTAPVDAKAVIRNNPAARVAVPKVKRTPWRIRF